MEKSLLGWKEFELEVMRDLADNVVIICSIENVDPMGVHTGDSITIAPAQTLTDKEYQRIRDASAAIIREMGVECGGSNVQMAINPKDGEVWAPPPVLSPLLIFQLQQTASLEKRDPREEQCCAEAPAKIRHIECEVTPISPQQFESCLSVPLIYWNIL